MTTSHPRVRLVPLTTEHADLLDQLVADPVVRTNTYIPEPPPQDMGRIWSEGVVGGRASGTRNGFIALDADGAFVGCLMAPYIDAAAGEVELGYMVVRERRGEGFGPELLRAGTRWALDELGARRVTLVIRVDNIASEAVARRSGYTREGVMRSKHFKAGLRTDAALWSRLPSDD